MKNLVTLKELVNNNEINVIKCKIYGVQAFNISGDEYEVITSFEKINGRYYFVDRCGRRYLASRYDRADFLAGEILDNLANAAEAVRLSVEQFREFGRVFVNADITADFEEAAEAAGLDPFYLGCGMVNDSVVNQYGPRIKKTEPEANTPNEGGEIIESRINATFEDSPISAKVRRFAQNLGHVVGVAVNGFFSALFLVLMLSALVAFIYLHVVGACVDCVADCWRNGSPMLAAFAVLMFYGGPVLLAGFLFFVYKDTNIMRRYVVNMFI